MNDTCWFYVMVLRYRMNKFKGCVPGIFLLLINTFIFTPVQAQLRLGTAASEINFRQGPGADFKVLQTINASNLLVILSREPQNGFVEAFDVETSSRGYVYESLIRITDSLNYGKQNFFEKSGEAKSGEVEIELVNGTGSTLFVWINKISYDLDPHEKKVLVLEGEEIIYFSSAPGLFPVFGKEILQRGNTYKWKFSL
jgi:hypothetical protein